MPVVAGRLVAFFQWNHYNQILSDFLRLMVCIKEFFPKEKNRRSSEPWSYRHHLRLQFCVLQNRKKLLRKRGLVKCSIASHSYLRWCGTKLHQKASGSKQHGIQQNFVKQGVIRKQVI